MSKQPGSASIANGSGAAAVLAAGIGSFAVATFAIAADTSSSIKSLLNIYRPTGPLSGVTTAAVLVWLLTWTVLELRWRNRTIALARTCAIAFALLVLSLLLTFPPIADIF
jgi:hypothetical protein